MSTTDTERRAAVASSRLAPWNRAMLAVLADGKWHSFEELIRAGAPLVPPHKAQQWYRTGLGNRHKGLAPWKVKATDTHDQIRDGRRDGLRRAISALRDNGYVEIRNPSGGKFIAGKEARLVKR